MRSGAWEAVIGLEIHTQLATASKIFSGAATAYGAAPNTQACLVDLGYPGTLPVLNAEVVRMAACFGLALVNRFLVYALFEGELLSLSGFIIDFIVLAALALIAHRLTMVHKMVAQYPWRYERESLWAYREKSRQS